VGTIKLSAIRRVVLFDLKSVPVSPAPSDPDAPTHEDVVEMRHYAVRAAPTGVNKAIKRLVQAKVPNLSKVGDVADYVLGRGAGAGEMSDSEVSFRSGGRARHNPPPPPC
jgi:ribosome biogenesis protein SSF1/2